MAIKRNQAWFFWRQFKMTGEQPTAATIYRYDHDILKAEKEKVHLVEAACSLGKLHNILYGQITARYQRFHGKHVFSWGAHSHGR